MRPKANATMFPNRPPIQEGTKMNAHGTQRAHIEAPGPSFLVRPEKDTKGRMDALEADLQPTSSAMRDRVGQYIRAVQAMAFNKGIAWEQFLTYAQDSLSAWNPDDFQLTHRMPIPLLPISDCAREAVAEMLSDEGYATTVRNYQQSYMRQSEDGVRVSGDEAAYLHALETFLWQESQTNLDGTPIMTGLLNGGLTKDLPVKAPGTSVRLPEPMKSPAIIEFIAHTIAFELAVGFIMRGEADFEVSGLDSELEFLHREVEEGLVRRFGERAQSLKERTERAPRFFEDYFLYLTLDLSVVPEGEFQRYPGAHVDGLQSSRILPKLPNSRVVIFASCAPTVFTDALWEPPRDMSGNYDYATDWFASMRACFPEPQSTMREERSMQLLAFSGLQIHSAGQMQKEGHRLFYRAIWTQQKFDREGNTINGRLGAFSSYEPRDPAPFFRNDGECSKE